MDLWFRRWNFQCIATVGDVPFSSGFRWFPRLGVRRSRFATQPLSLYDDHEAKWSAPNDDQDAVSKAGQKFASSVNCQLCAQRGGFCSNVKIFSLSNPPIQFFLFLWSFAKDIALGQRLPLFFFIGHVCCCRCCAFRPVSDAWPWRMKL